MNHRRNNDVKTKDDNDNDNDNELSDDCDMQTMFTRLAPIANNKQSKTEKLFERDYIEEYKGMNKEHQKINEDCQSIGTIPNFD